MSTTPEQHCTAQDAAPFAGAVDLPARKPADRISTGRRFTVQQASAHGYGHPDTIRARINDGRLRAERLSGGSHGTYWIAEADLEASDLVRFKARGPESACDVALNDSATLGELAVLIARLVTVWPTFSAQQRRDLDQYLAAA